MTLMSPSPWVQVCVHWEMFEALLTMYVRSRQSVIQVQACPHCCPIGVLVRCLPLHEKPTSYGERTREGDGGDGAYQGREE